MSACTAQQRTETFAPRVRPPCVAGAFYPGSPSQLREDVSELINGSPEDAGKGTVVAAMAPHAGYVFSGNVAGMTFQQLKDLDADTVVIIGHDARGDAVAYVCPVDFYQTPLGRVPVDTDMVKAILSYHPGIRPETSMHAREHTVEVQLPFLQTLGKDCKIVPLLFGNPTAENCRILAEAIRKAGAGKKVFVLASTDMSHYPTYEQACELDRSTLEIIRSMDVDRLFLHLAQRERDAGGKLSTAMCARGGVGTAILFAKEHGATEARVLQYANSGDAPVGDKRRVVGYGSVLFVRPEAPVSGSAAN